MEWAVEAVRAAHDLSGASQFERPQRRFLQRSLIMVAFANVSADSRPKRADWRVEPPVVLRLRGVDFVLRVSRIATCTAS